jgi:hypothetical protein
MRNDLAARAMAIFEKVVEHAAEDRGKLIEIECGADAELRALVEQVVRNYDAGRGAPSARRDGPASASMVRSIHALSTRSAAWPSRMRR